MRQAPSCKRCGAAIKWNPGSHGGYYAIDPETSEKHKCGKAKAGKILSWPNVSGLRNLRDLYAGMDVDVRKCSSVLSLVTCPEIPDSIIETWTEEQRRHAVNWAVRVYMDASDNGTELLAEPDFLKELRNE